MKTMKKIIAIATALTVSVFLVGPGIAQGATVEELQAQIAVLTAQLAVLQQQLAQLQRAGTHSFLGIETEEEDVKNQESPEKTLVESLVKDLENRVLTEKEAELLAKAKEDINAGNYSEALIKIFDLLPI